MGHLGLAALFPVAVVHLVGPAVGPVLLVLGELGELLGVGRVVDLDRVLDALAVARDLVGRHRTVLAELDPLVGAPWPTRSWRPRRRWPRCRGCSSSRGRRRSGSGRGRHRAEGDVVGPPLALGGRVDVLDGVAGRPRRAGWPPRRPGRPRG